MGICSMDSKKFWSKFYGCLLANVFLKRLFVKIHFQSLVSPFGYFHDLKKRRKVPHNNIYKTLEKKFYLGLAEYFFINS